MLVCTLRVYYLAHLDENWSNNHDTCKGCGRKTSTTPKSIESFSKNIIKNASNQRSTENKESQQSFLVSESVSIQQTKPTRKPNHPTASPQMDGHRLAPPPPPGRLVASHPAQSLQVVLFGNGHGKVGY